MTFDPWTVGLQAINFIVLVWLLQRFLFKPVAGAIARRQQAVDNLFGEARQAQESAEAAAQEAGRRHGEIDAKKDEIFAAARTEAAGERQHILEKAEAEARDMLKQERARLTRERQDTLAEMQQTAVDLAVDMSKSLLSNVKDGAIAEAVRVQALAALAALPPEEMNSLRDQLRPGHPLQVITAHELTGAEQRVWRDELGALLGNDPAIEFGVDPSLIAGTEIHAPGTVLRFSWRDTLDRLKGEWPSHVDSS